MSAARNLGISYAQGDYIGFLDADDLWLPQKLEEQLAIFSRHREVGMVYGRTQIFSSWAESNEHQDHFYELGVKPNSIIYPPVLFKQLLENTYQTPTTCNALMRRRVFEQCGTFESEFTTMYEDQVFFSKVTLKLPVYVSDAYWAKYRQHPESCSIKNSNQSYYKTRQPFIIWLQRYIDNQPAPAPEIIRLIKRELWQCQNPRAAYVIVRVKYYAERFQSLLRRLPLLTTNL